MTTQVAGQARRLLWTKARIIAFLSGGMLVLGAVATYAGAKGWQHGEAGALLPFAFAGLLFYGAVSSAVEIARWEPEEVDAYEKSTRGMWWKLTLAVFSAAFAATFVQTATGPFDAWIWDTFTIALAGAVILWIVLRSRKFNKEARRKIAERKAREAQLASAKGSSKGKPPCPKKTSR